MIIKDWFNPNTASGDYLDDLCNLTVISREYYGDDESIKPNDYCIWLNVGFTCDIWRWVENDEHLRQRVKESSK